MSRHSLLISTAFVAFALPAAVQAQDGSEDEQDSIVVTGSYTLPDRIDTATGLGLTIRETPQSVSIITAQRILDQRLDTVADVIARSTGVSVNEVDDVRNTFTARGFEITNYQVDGVPLAWTLAGGAGETMADVSIYERIEIVRGATGLLTGAGDPSASINLVRKHANSAEWGGYLNASAGSWDTWQLSGDIGGAVTTDGRVRMRAVARYEEGGSQIEYFQDKKLVLYGVVDADLTERTLLRVGASHQRETPTAPQWGALPSFYSDGGFIEWERSKSSSALWSYWNTTNQNIFATVEHEFANDWVLTANYNWLRNAQQTEILYIFGVLDRTTGEGLSSYPYADDGSSIQNSFDVRLNGRFGLFGRSHDFAIGALHSKQNRENTTFAALAFPPVGNFFDHDPAAFPNPGFSTTGVVEVDETVKQTGFYGAVRLDLSDRLKAIGGGRISSWEIDGFNFGPPREYGDKGVFIPYAGLLYDITPNHRLYASYTSIFEPQNARDRFGDFLPPVDGRAFEIGLKSSFFDDALQTSLAVFRIEQDNLAQTDTGYFIPGVTPPTEASFAAKGATSEGFEIEIVGQPLPGWNISMGFSHFTARDANGDPVNTDHPRDLFNLFTTYTLDRLTLGGGVNWRSRNYSNSFDGIGNPFVFEQPAFALVSLMARYEISDAIQLQVNVENLFDEVYYSQIGFFQQYRYGAGRNFTAGVTARF